LAFSTGGDGGRKSPEQPTQSAHVIFGGQRLLKTRKLASDVERLPFKTPAEVE